MDVGFLILNPEKNVIGLKNTLNSIKNQSYDRESICVVGDNTTPEEMKAFKGFCQTYQAGNKVTSLINIGMKKLKHEWCLIIFAGSRIPAFVEKKLECFAKKESDVLFPVIERKFNFVDAPFNGVLINRRFFIKVGEFSTADMQKEGLNDFELTKVMWTISAIEQGVTFKAIVGLRII